MLIIFKKIKVVSNDKMAFGSLKKILLKDNAIQRIEKIVYFYFFLIADNKKYVNEFC